MDLVVKLWLVMLMVIVGTTAAGAVYFHQASSESRACVLSQGRPVFMENRGIICFHSWEVHMPHSERYKK